MRYHAAGHLAAALLLAQEPKAARIVLGVVKRFTELPTVSAPPAITEMLDAAIKDPSASSQEITTLEAWFVDPFNTVIEKSGAKFK